MLMIRNYLSMAVCFLSYAREWRMRATNKHQIKIFFVRQILASEQITGSEVNIQKKLLSPMTTLSLPTGS